MAKSSVISSLCVSISGVLGVMQLMSTPLVSQLAAEPEVEALVVRVHATTCSGQRWGTATLLADGRVLTNRHVVEGATSVEVDFPAGPAPVRFVATANPVDVAVMHLDPGVSVPGLGLADAAEVGMAGALIGFPGAGNRVRRDAAVMSFEEGNAGHDPVRVARLDAVVVPGESGSPLVVDGKIAALVYESATTTHRARAIPAPELRGAMDAAARQDWARCGR